MKTLLAVLFACILSVCMAEDCKDGQLEKGCKPKFCGGYECPKYWTIARRKGYDIRCYATTTWAMTRSLKPNQVVFTSEFMKLFAYVEKHNSEKKKIGMTVPVFTGNWFNMTTKETNSLLGFWIPTPCNTTTPTPNDGDVFLKKQDKFCVYVRKFGGYNVGNTMYMYHHLYKLTKDLQKDGKSHVKVKSAVNTYDNPLTIFGRHNEVWRWPSEKDQEQYLAMVEDSEIDRTCQ